MNFSSTDEQLSRQPRFGTPCFKLLMLYAQMHAHIHKYITSRICYLRDRGRANCPSTTVINLT